MRLLLGIVMLGLVGTGEMPHQDQVAHKRAGHEFGIGTGKRLRFKPHQMPHA